MENYREYLDDAGVEVKSEREYIIKAEEFARGAYHNYEVDVDGDIYNKEYVHSFELYDPVIDFTYSEDLRHDSREELTKVDDNISLHREQAGIYLLL